MSEISFIKMHGLVNDFVVVDARGGDVALDSARVRAIAERRLGVGCDQLLEICPPRSAKAAAFMRIWNADGGQVEACGNGTRCVAAFLMMESGASETPIETVAGLLKAEAAWTGGFEFTCADDKKSRFEVMGGVEYYGLSESILVLEIGERHIFDYEGVVGGFPTFEREDSLTYAFRYSADWLNARLSTTLLAIVFGSKAQDGAILRLQGAYALRDGLILTLGVLLFQEGELPPLDTWGRNDRVFLDLKWSF